MAEIKKPKRRIIDVSHPDSTLPSDTSKAVIVKNHALLKDPMMRDEAATSDEEKPTTDAPHKIETKLGTAPTLSSALEAPLAEALKKHDKPAVAVEAPETVEADGPADQDAKLETKASVEPAEDTTSLPEPTAAQDKEAARTDEPKAAEESKVETSAPAEPAKPEAAEPKAQPETKAQPEAKPAPAPDLTPAAKPDAPDETTTDSITEPVEAPKGPTVEAENAAAAAAAKREAELQKLVESKKYVLPINSLEQRRTKRIVLLGLLLSLLLAAAWVDIALDAGLIHLSGLHPVTHFFST